METNGKIERDASSERSWFAAEALAIFEAPEFTARGRAAAIVQRIQAMEIAPEHEAGVATLVRDFVGLLKEAGARAFISEIDRSRSRETKHGGSIWRVRACRSGGRGDAVFSSADSFLQRR